MTKEVVSQIIGKLGCDAVEGGVDPVQVKVPVWVIDLYAKAGISQPVLLLKGGEIRVPIDPSNADVIRVIGERGEVLVWSL